MTESAKMKLTFAIPVIFFIVTLAPFSYSAYYFYKAVTSSTWPSTQGRIIECNYRQSNELKSPNTLAIKYSYTVGNQHYNGSTINFDDGMNDTARSILACKFPVGAIVKVYYNPQKPSDSVLIKGFRWQGHALLYITSFFMLFTIIMGIKIYGNREQIIRQYSSYEILVWKSPSKASETEAAELYQCFKTGEEFSEYVVTSADLEAFLKELTEKYPQLDKIPDEEFNHLKWDYIMVICDNVLYIPIKWECVEEVKPTIKRLAEKYELNCYDPQIPLFYKSS